MSQVSGQRPRTRRHLGGRAKRGHDMRGRWFEGFVIAGPDTHVMPGLVPGIHDFDRFVMPGRVPSIRGRSHRWLIGFEDPKIWTH